LFKQICFNSPKSGIPVRQNLGIIKRSEQPEFFLRKVASIDTMYKVFYFQNDFIKIIHDKSDSRHGVVRPQVATRGTTSNTEISCEYIT